MESRIAPQENVPVFVVGSGRSGTTLLAHLLQLSGDFPIYLAETRILPSRFTYGDLSEQARRARFEEDFRRSRQWARSGLSPDELRPLLTAEVNYVTFLGRFMDAVARRQGKGRWMEKTPANVRFIPEIAAAFPTARFVHIVRDGRDVALSVQRLGEVPDFRGDLLLQLLWAGERWRYRTSRARIHLSALPGRGLQVRYEDLVLQPEVEIPRIAHFCGIQIDLEGVLASDFGSLGRANTAFNDTGKGLSTQAVNRWSRQLPGRLARLLSYALRSELVAYGYPLPEHMPVVSEKLSTAGKRMVIATSIWGKEWVRQHTFLGQRSESPLELRLD